METPGPRNNVDYSIDARRETRKVAEENRMSVARQLGITIRNPEFDRELEEIAAQLGLSENENNQSAESPLLTDGNPLLVQLIRLGSVKTPPDGAA